MHTCLIYILVDTKEPEARHSTPFSTIFFHNSNHVHIEAMFDLKQIKQSILHILAEDK